MRICEFCLQFREDSTCFLGLPLPKSMTCREFDPAMEKFCSERKDFVDPRQITQMATYFGVKGPELKKIKLMASREEASRLEAALNPDSAITESSSV